MSNIRIINKYTIECSKPEWSSEERFLASCLDINEVDNKHIVDVRVVAKKAFVYFLNRAFPYLMKSPSRISQRKALFVQFKSMYQGVYNDFMTDFYPKAGYMSKLNKDLYQHQKDVLSSSINRRHNLWALDMGTGKTLTAATLSKITGCRRTIIICPSLVKFNWFEDMTRYWGYNQMYWTIIDAKKSRTIKAFKERFVVLNFEQVRKNMEYLLSDEVNHVIIDEAHYLKNHNSNRSKAVAELINRAGEPRVTMLTGTPVTNRVNDMFNYLKMSNHPLGKNFTAFKKKYTISGARNKVIGAQNIPDLKEKIANLMIRLRSEDCLTLPDMVIKNYYFEANEISKDYEEELANLREKKKQYDLLHGVEKQKMNHQINNNIHTLNRLVATSKVPKIHKLIEHLTDQVNESGEIEKVVVFSGYKDPLNQLEEILGDACVKIDGSVDSHKRLQLINRFKEDDNCKVFLGNTQAAGIGINLVNSRHVILMNFPFTPDQIEQAQKRLHRSGQKRKVNVYYTIAKETIDEHIYSLVADKAEDINMLIDGDHKSAINYGSISGELFKLLLKDAA